MLSTTIFNPKQKKTFSAKLSLVALMDIFTILVFFLLLNSGDSQQLESAKFITLPDSSAGDNPHEDLIILIGEDQVLLGEEALIDVATIMKSPDKLIAPLADALNAHTEKRGDLNSFEKANGLAVTIMGDRSVPYTLLKSVMTTCRQQNYRNISLAVNQVVAFTHPAAVR